MKLAIVIVALIMAYAEFGQAIRFRWAWTKWGLGFMGLYWAAYYIQSLLGIGLLQHQIWVRSGILMMLALVGANALMSLRRIR